jgi:type IV pilus assembly protein PilM
VNSINDIISTIRHVDLEKIRGLRPNYPPVAIEVSPREIVLVRLKRRRGKTYLEAHQARDLADVAVGSSIVRPNLGSPDTVAQKIRDLLAATGTKPGRVSLVLPDNLAKVSLLTLPELPASRKQLTELIRFRLRRAVPFRLDHAAVSYQILQGDGKEVTVLVALMLRSVIEQYERVVQAAGARPGLVDLCTPNLFNLCRRRLVEASGGSRDVALLNCSAAYFSLLIVRGERLVFYRCKSYAVGNGDGQTPNGVLAREINNSLSYYQEKLGGEGIETIFVRSVGKPMEEMVHLLEPLSFQQVVPVDPTSVLTLAEGLRLDPEVAQRIAPAVGAAAGRG